MSEPSQPVEVTYLDLEDVLHLATLLLEDPPPVRDHGLLGAAVARPAITAFGADAYPDLWTKAGALLQSVVINPALIDGNKRLGWLSTAVFLQLNGIEIVDATNDDVYDLVIWVASTNPPLDEIVPRLRVLVA